MAFVVFVVFRHRKTPFPGSVKVMSTIWTHLTATLQTCRLVPMHIDNILRVYNQRTPTEHAAGMSWYDDAHALALSLSPGDVWRGAGVIAAYSPLTPWNRNVELATKSLVWGGAHTGSLGNSVRAAQRIIDGEHTLDVLKGDKTRAFASAIADPAGSTIATIDRHAYDVAMGEVHTNNTRKIGKRVFRELSDAYVDSAFWCEIGVAQMQAITWVVWRRLKGIK